MWQQSVRAVDGAVNDVWRVPLDDGTAYVLKGSLDAPADLFPLEAAGLRALHRRAGIRIPRLFEVSAHHVLGTPTDGWACFPRTTAPLPTAMSSLGVHRPGGAGCGPSPTSA